MNHRLKNMAKQRVLAFILLLFSALQLAAQHTEQVHIEVLPTFQHEPLALEHTYLLPGQDSITFETLRFYLSGVALYKDNDPVYIEPQSYHLMDVADDHSMGIDLSVPGNISYNAIRFNIGVDSEMNTSGAQGGDLDPVNGMYWAWQSGYINLKLEGTSNLCATRKHMFQFHLGGYLPPNNTLQHVSLAVQKGTPVVIEMPLDRFVNAVDLKKQNSVMIPCAEAVTLSGQIARLFEIKQ